MPCAHCGSAVGPDAPTTADHDRICEACARKATTPTEGIDGAPEFDEDGDPINEATPTDVSPGA